MSPFSPHLGLQLCWCRPLCNAPCNTWKMVSNNTHMFWVPLILFRYWLCHDHYCVLPELLLQRDSGMVAVLLVCILHITPALGQLWQCLEHQELHHSQAGQLNWELHHFGWWWCWKTVQTVRPYHRVLGVGTNCVSVLHVIKVLKF